MSLKVIRQILESPGCAEGSDWALLIAMANRASDDGSGVWESVKSLALNAGNMGESTARKSLAKLRKAGVAVWTGKWHKNRNGQPTKIYGLDLSKIKTSQNETPQIETQVGFKLSAGGSQIERQTSPEPVQEPERENEGDPARSLAIRFWEWQGKPARYRKGSGWTERFRKLLAQHFDLPDILRHFFEEDTFWPRHLIRESGDPLDYLEGKLPDLSQRYCAQLARKKSAARKDRPRPGKPAASPPRDAAAPPAGEPLWGLERMRKEQAVWHNLEGARAYFAAHRKEYEELHPEWLEEFKFRRIYGPESD